MFQTTNPRPQKKFAMRSPSNFDQFLPGADARRARERGYTMVALLAMMSLMALFALAAAPSVRQQAQREREKEAIFRGEQVSDAIRSYYRYRGGQGVNSLPTSIDQLLEGIPRGTKKLQILRPEAAHDPLSSDGEWRRIGPASPDLGQFVQSLTVYSGGVRPHRDRNSPRWLRSFRASQMFWIPGRRTQLRAAKILHPTPRVRSSAWPVAVNAIR
jgi:type II secretory pathway pseudopilin PulG